MFPGEVPNDDYSTLTIDNGEKRLYSISKGQQRKD